MMKTSLHFAQIPSQGAGTFSSGYVHPELLCPHIDQILASPLNRVITQSPHATVAIEHGGFGGNDLFTRAQLAVEVNGIPMVIQGQPIAESQYSHEPALAVCSPAGSALLTAQINALNQVASAIRRAKRPPFTIAPNQAAVNFSEPIELPKARH